MFHCKHGVPEHHHCEKCLQEAKERREPIDQK